MNKKVSSKTKWIQIWGKTLPNT